VEFARILCTRVVQSVDCGRHISPGSVIFTAEAFEMSYCHLTLSLATSSWNAEAVLKIYELFVYGVIHYVIDLFCRNVIKVGTH